MLTFITYYRQLTRIFTLDAFLKARGQGLIEEGSSVFVVHTDKLDAIRANSKIGQYSEVP